MTDHSSSLLVKFSSKCVLDLRFHNCLVLPKILLEGTDWQVTQDAATHICPGVALNLERNFLNFHTSQFRVLNLDFVAKIPGSVVVSLSSNLDSTDKWFRKSWLCLGHERIHLQCNNYSNTYIIEVCEDYIVHMKLLRKTQTFMHCILTYKYSLIFFNISSPSQTLRHVLVSRELYLTNFSGAALSLSSILCCPLPNKHN